MRKQLLVACVLALVVGLGFALQSYLLQRQEQRQCRVRTALERWVRSVERRCSFHCHACGDTYSPPISTAAQQQFRTRRRDARV